MNTLKFKLLLILLLVSTTATTQNDKERFTLGISTELADKNTHNNDFDYGFNIGAHVELQGKLFYVRARSFYFPELNNITYLDFDGGGGFNWRDWKDQNRIYIGAFIGAIYRQGWGHGKTGIEIGYEHYFNNGFYLGIKADNQYKHDDKIWRNTDSGHTVNSIGLTIGYSWYYCK